MNDDVNGGMLQLYINIGDKIMDIAHKYPEIGVPMMKYWMGEISWEEQVNMIAHGNNNLFNTNEILQKCIPDNLTINFMKKENLIKYDFSKYINTILKED
ncbi:MAG: hypothetical protein E6356_14000 [Terrisporobacter othiniensis]|nr:hypothetical protein [Terrisporobacter othiniensis]